MPLVHVKARNDPRVFIAQFQRPLRITFQIHPRWEFLRRSQGKQLAAHFVNQHFRPKGRSLLHMWQGKAIGAEFSEIHAPFFKDASSQVNPRNYGVRFTCKRMNRLLPALIGAGLRYVTVSVPSPLGTGEPTNTASEAQGPAGDALVFIV